MFSKAALYSVTTERSIRFYSTENASTIQNNHTLLATTQSYYLHYHITFTSYLIAITEDYKKIFLADRFTQDASQSLCHLLFKSLFLRIFKNCYINSHLACSRF